MKTAAYRHRHAALQALVTSYRMVSTSMTFNDLE